MSQLVFSCETELAMHFWPRAIYSAKASYPLSPGDAISGGADPGIEFSCGGGVSESDLRRPLPTCGGGSERRLLVVEGTEIATAPAASSWAKCAPPSAAAPPHAARRAPRCAHPVHA